MFVRNVFHELFHEAAVGVLETATLVAFQITVAGIMAVFEILETDCAVRRDIFAQVPRLNHLISDAIDGGKPHIFAQANELIIDIFNRKFATLVGNSFLDFHFLTSILCHASSIQLYLEFENGFHFQNNRYAHASTLTFYRKYVIIVIMKPRGRFNEYRFRCGCSE